VGGLALELGMAESGVGIGVDAPVFVLAPARSCSSVIVAMLGRHPALYGFPELRLFRADRVGSLLLEPKRGTAIPNSERTAGLVRTLAQLHEGVQSPEAVDRALAWLGDRRTLPVADVLRHLLALVAPRVGVEKSPESSRTDEALRRVVDAFPGARYLHLVRHPWPTIASMIAAWQGLPYWNVSPEDAAQYCLAVWVEQHERIVRLGADLPHHRYLRIRAEDLLNQPMSNLPPVCRWLGIDDDWTAVRLMTAPELSPYAGPGPPNAMAGYDPKFHADPRLRPVAATSSLLPEGIEMRGALIDSARQLAAPFGYMLEADYSDTIRGKSRSMPGRSMPG
jgi:Sulfotransferase family